MTEAAAKILGLVDQLGREGIQLDHIDLGGGLGIRYRDEEPPHPSTYLKAAAGLLRRSRRGPVLRTWPLPGGQRQACC